MIYASKIGWEMSREWSKINALMQVNLPYLRALIDGRQIKVAATIGQMNLLCRMALLNSRDRIRKSDI